MTIEDDIAFFERVPTLGCWGARPCAFSRSAPRAATSTAARRCSTPARRPTAPTWSRKAASACRRRQADGGEGVTVGAGTLLGEIALLTETKRPVTATALEPSTVLRIPRSLFLKMLEGFRTPPAGCVTSSRRAPNHDGEIHNVRGILDA